MLREINRDALVHIQVAQDKGIVVTAYNIIGNIMNCQDAYFLKMQRDPMIGLLRILLKSGVKS